MCDHHRDPHVVDPGDDVIGVAPYFPEFRLYCETASARFVPVPRARTFASTSTVSAERCPPHTAAVIVNSPCNPSGHVLDGGELAGLAAILEAHNSRHDRKVLLIVDEVYRRLTYAPHRRVEPFAAYEHTVLARSFSKDLGVAGERIGYLVLHPSLVSAETHRGLAQSLRALGFVNAPATAQRALLHLDSWEINATPYLERRDLVWIGSASEVSTPAEPRAVCTSGCAAPGRDTLQLIDALAARRVLLTPGIAFGVPATSASASAPRARS